MKTIYKILIITAITLTTVTYSMAQTTSEKDTTLNRHILLERDFNPTLQDASKINTVPAVHEHIVKEADIRFETAQPELTIRDFPVGDTGPAEIKTDADYDKKRGYLTFGGGNYLNLTGSLGYRIVDSANDKFDIFARHNSTNGDIKYAEKGYALDKAKAKYMDNFVKAKYKHFFEFLDWHLDASFRNLSFNYYGNPFGAGSLFELDKKQTVNVIHAETGITSKQNNEFRYSGLVKFDNFSTKYGPTIDFDGAGGNIIEGIFDFAAPFGSDKFLGVRLNALNQSFGDIDFADKKDVFHSLTKLSATPYVDFEGGDFQLSLGVNVAYAIDNENKLNLAPDVRFSWQFADKTLFYASATGGINENTYLQILDENRYVYPGGRIGYSRTPVDATIGIKSGAVNALEFDIFGGIKYTKDEHFYASFSTQSWANVSAHGYYDLMTGHIGGLLKTSLIPYTDLSAKLVAYFYDAKNGSLDESGIEYKAYNRPSFTVNLNADINPVEKIKFSVNYFLATGRKAFSLADTDPVKMKNINELNLRGEYQVFDKLSVEVRLNNVLNQKYETWHGYTHQGLNILGGINLKF